jgi:hypothetical protein
VIEYLYAFYLMIGSSDAAAKLTASRALEQSGLRDWLEWADDRAGWSRREHPLNIIRQPTAYASTAEIGKMANHETRTFDCPSTESRCAEAGCSLTHCVRREREDRDFRRRQEVNVAKILAAEQCDEGK